MNWTKQFANGAVDVTLREENFRIRVNLSNGRELFASRYEDINKLSCNDDRNGSRLLIQLRSGATLFIRHDEMLANEATELLYQLDSVMRRGDD